MRDIVGNKAPDPTYINTVGNGGAIASRLIPTFAGTQYGTIDTPVVFTGDFEIESEVVIPNGATGTFQVLVGAGTTADYCGTSAAGVLTLKINGLTLSSAPVTVDPFDGKTHLWKVSRVGSVGMLMIDGIMQITGTVGTGNSIWEMVGANVLPTAVNFLNGQLLSVKFINSPTRDFVFDSGSTTEQYARGGLTDKMTLINFSASDWDKYTLQKPYVYLAVTYPVAWVDNSDPANFLEVA